MKLQTSGSFASAHWLSNYKGNCQNLHGHTYFYYLEVENSILKDDMLVDFSIIKELDHSLMVNKYDEFYVMYKQPLNNKFHIIEFDTNPTAERIAEWIRKKIIKEIGECVIKVRVWEDIKTLINHDDLRLGKGEFIEAK